MKLKADKVSVKKLLSQNGQQFRIPPYQRPYAWGDEQVDALWQDILDSVGSNHFLGSLVVANEDDDRPQVIDGQQRLTTLMILLSVVREALHTRGQADAVQSLNTLFKADFFAKSDSQFKVRTGNANWPVFRDFIMRGPDDPERKTLDDLDALDPELRTRNAPLFSNWTRLGTAVEAELEPLSPNLQVERLGVLLKALIEGVELVHIEVEDLSDAFMLFETLNDRGLQLSAADLLKNHLLGAIAESGGDEEDVDAAAAQWDDMLQDLGAHVDVSRFLRHYLLVSLPKVKKDEIFRHFKARVAAEGPIAILKDLRIAARAYGEFESPEKVKDAAARSVLTDLQTLRATTCYVALIPARRYLSSDDFVEYARLAEVLTFRYSSVVGLGTNELERQYHEAAKLLDASQGERLAESRAVLVAAMPDSEQFRVAFERMAMGRQYLLRYALGKIEKSLSPPQEKLIVESDLVHIEHIMPKTLTDKWKRDLGSYASQHADYLNRWGNLTLFFRGLNIPASNKSFAEKRPYYRKSQVHLTKELLEYRRWGIPQIEERQRHLAELADALWAVPKLDSVGADMSDAVNAGGQPTPHAKTDSHGPHSDALADFREVIGYLWPAVEPHCGEVSAEDVRALAELAPEYLDDHGTHQQAARQLSDALAGLLAEWDRLDGSQRRVLAGALAYYLDPDDDQPDDEDGGLDDDSIVVAAACRALARADLVTW